MANGARFLREMICDLLGNEPDIEVVGEVAEPAYENIETVMDQTHPEFLSSVWAWTRLGTAFVGTSEPFLYLRLRGATAS